MSNSTPRYIPKLSDRDVIRAFESIASKHAEEGARVRFNDPFGQVAEEEVAALKKLAGHTLTHATLTLDHRNWQWTRLRAEHQDRFSAEYDKLTFSFNPQSGPVDRIATSKVTAALDAALSRPIASIDPDTATLASHSAILLAMESATAKILEDATEHRRDLDRAYAEKEQALSVRAQEERERELGRLREERDRVEAELSTRTKTLEARREELDTLQKKLDDRNNTHVRREIRASLLALTKERLANFAVSKETRNQYLAVHGVAILGIVLLAYGSLYFGSQAVPNADGTYASGAIAFAVKSAALAAAGIALGSWYLGWLNRWLQRIADAEFKLQQFRLDIERASWLAETVLEWKATSAEPFPDLLATRLSSGLFVTGSSESNDPKTPATHLAEALFGAASSARLKLGDQELGFDRKSIRGLAKDDA
jgi:flagellar motility protein MotE (MotC chaperone)